MIFREEPAPARRPVNQIVLLALALALGVAAVASVRPMPLTDEFPTPAPVGVVRPVTDARRVVGAHACAACHARETEVWRASAHRRGARALLRGDAAREIALALGIAAVHSDTRCTTCHFTVQAPNGAAAVAIDAVSCESCHGPARDWIERHADFGVGVATAERESPEHRALRLARCDDAGMNRVGDLVGLASRCFGCHRTADRELVAAGHPVGRDFEFVSWSQGVVRHNFVRGDGKNAVSSPERTRVMYVVGKLLDVEFAFLALARARDPGDFASLLEGRAHASVAALARIQALIPTREVALALARARSVESVPAGRGLAAAATFIHSCAERFVAEQDGRDLSALDAELAEGDGEGEGDGAASQ